MTYKRIVVGVDGSTASRYASDAALAIAGGSPGAEVIGCHVHATRLHRTRFEEMEPGLPGRYHEEERLAALRSTHEDLIADGMDLISDAYLAPLAGAAADRGLRFEGLAPEGRNYVELLRVLRERRPDLAVIGAVGLGAVPETAIGSLCRAAPAPRIRHGPPGDEAAAGAREPPRRRGRGRQRRQYLALRRALEIARTFGTEVAAVAVYDPFFHTGVFRTIAGILPAESQKRFDFSAQERLHNEIIDQGLESLYRRNLDRGRPLADALGVTLLTDVLAGKVCTQLDHYSALKHAGLLVLGRYGLHREGVSAIGSTTLNAARMSAANLLVVAPPSEPLALPDVQDEETEPLVWTDEAARILDRVPGFARPMARAAIETAPAGRARRR